MGIESIIFPPLTSLKSSNQNLFLSAFRLNSLVSGLILPISLSLLYKIPLLMCVVLVICTMMHKFPSLSMVSRCSICLSLASETPKLSEKLASETLQIQIHKVLEKIFWIWSIPERNITFLDEIFINPLSLDPLTCLNLTIFCKNY